jgi:tetratricopeptide (TPR) repeat protein
VAERGGNASWDVFLAYASPDRARARELYDALVALGLNVCFDQAVLQGGDDWDALLPQYLEASRVVVALISNATVRAHHQRSELIEALDMVRGERGRLIPVRLVAGARLPYGTQQLHALELYTPDAVARVAGQIADTLPPVPRTTIFSDRVPRPPRYFTGRDALLAKLRSTQPGSATVLTAIHGLGGVGKTSLAAAYVDARRGDFDVIWWVRSEDPSLLVADLAGLARHLGLPKLDDPAETATAVRRELQATDRSWLLVFDNVPDERSIDAWLPRHGQGSVIITSRSPDFSDVDEVLAVDTLPPDVAEDFLRSRIARRNEAAATEDLTAIVGRLGGLPLALEQAAAWVAQVPRRRFAELVRLYDDAAKDPFPDGTRPLAYEHTATTTWRVSIAAAKAAAPLADRAMALLSFMAPEEVACGWLREMGDDEYFDRSGSVAVQEALDVLHGYSLATISDDDTIVVHRVVQAVTRRTAPVEAVDAAIRAVRRQSPGQAWDHVHWPTLVMLTPHVLALAIRASADVPNRAEDLWLMLDGVASYRRAFTAVRDAPGTQSAARKIASTFLRGDPTGTRTSQGRLGLADGDSGSIGRSIPLLESKVADVERTRGPDHPETFIRRNNLAYAYRALGHHSRAMPLLEANLTDCERVLGVGHRQTVGCRNNLASAYEAVGDVARAIPLLEANRSQYELLLGPHHPQTLGCRNRLASAYGSAGDLDRAVTLLEDNLAACERALGAEHRQTLACRNNLAGAYGFGGQVDRAVPLLETNVSCYERALGPDHLQTLVCRNILASAYHDAWDDGRALPLLEANVVDCEQALGPDHPQTRIARGNLDQARRPGSQGM